MVLGSRTIRVSTRSTVARRRGIVASAMARRSNAAGGDAALLECERMYEMDQLDFLSDVL